MTRVLIAVFVLVVAANPALGQTTTQYTNSNSNLRESPSTAAQILGVVPRGSEVSAVCDGDWCSVSTHSGEQGYISRSLLRDTPPPAPQLSDSEIRRMLIRQSINSYSGSCPCPYNADRAGRSCGKRSAYSRPGGASPLCYESDISAEMIRRFRERTGQ